MKKILFGLLVAALSLSTVNSNAQGTASAPLKAKTITAADTSTWNNLPSNIVSFQGSIKKSSGTLAGKIYLEVTDDAGGAWFKIDSVTLADNTNWQGLKKDIAITQLLHARIIYTNTSGATASTRNTYVRRTDENK